MIQKLARPTIPVAENPERWKKVQAMMATQELDFLVAYADDRATFGPAHARWLANFPVHFEPVCILLPKQGAPMMLVGPESDQYARLAGQLTDVRVLRNLLILTKTIPIPQSRACAISSPKPAGRDLLYDASVWVDED